MAVDLLVIGMPSGILKPFQAISGNLTETKKEALKERTVMNYPALY